MAVQKLTVNELIAYLDNAEGSSIHRNKTESDVTAFYGVYRKYHRSFSGWTWLDNIAKEYNLVYYRTNLTQRKTLNKIIKDCDTLWEKYNDYAAKYHTENMKKMHLDSFPSSKTALTYFSLATNAGTKRATKILQKALNSIDIKTTVDGDFGPNTRRNLESVSDTLRLNHYMLAHMQSFYDYLIKKNPRKYKLYAKGWTNRLNALA